jgi:acyl-CoA thioesterase I
VKFKRERKPNPLHHQTMPLQVWVFQFIVGFVLRLLTDTDKLALAGRSCFNRAKGMTNKTKLAAAAIAIVFLSSSIAVLEINNLQNPKRQTPPSNGAIRVACVGDSITQDSDYPSDLQFLLGANYSVGNFGARGSTALINSWKPYMDQPEFQDAQNFRPAIVVVMLGTNDDLKSLQQYNESFEVDYARLNSSFQRLNTDPQIFVAESPPIFSNSSDLSAAYFSNTIIPQTIDLANKLNLPTIDVYDAIGNHTEYFTDGVHPNSQGAALIASEVYDAIYAENTEVPGEP